MAEKIICGKRKTSVAKVRIKEGSGKIIINEVPHHLLSLFHRLSIEEPIRIAKKIIPNFNYEINVKIRGGGRESQIEAARLGIAKAIVEKTKSEALKKAYLKYDKYMLIADTRRKETYKPGDSKARAKRQKSYR